MNVRTVTLASRAMATRFEIVLHGADPAALRAAGEEALAEIERIEAQLSFYRPSSEISHLNARAADGPVQVSPAVFALLDCAKRMSEETNGAFDITIAPLVRAWGFIGGGGKVPTDAELASARDRVGMHLVQLDSANRTVRFSRKGVMLDLGGIGKGYAIEKAAELLRDAGVTSGLIHGGTSTVCAIGHPPDAEHWRVAIEPGAGAVQAVGPEQRSGQGTSEPSRTNPIATPSIVSLRDDALSVSAAAGKCFEFEGRAFGHVLDPRTGTPAQGVLLAAIVLPSATEADALSTALLVSGDEGLARVTATRPRARTLLVKNNSSRVCENTAIFSSPFNSKG